MTLVERCTGFGASFRLRKVVLEDTVAKLEQEGQRFKASSSESALKEWAARYI